MLDTVVQLLSAFAGDPEHGVNALAPLIPRATLSPGIVGDAPPIVTICNDVDNESVARDLDPDAVPALMFWGDSSVDVELRGYKTAKEVIIAAAYVTEDGADPLAASRARGLILRAGILTFNRYNSQDKSLNYRKLNGISVMQITKITEQRVTAAVGRRRMWGFLALQVIAAETLS